MKLIGLAGHARCGKSTLASVCAAHGYTVVHFADPLKDLVAELIGVSRGAIERLKVDRTVKFPLDEASMRVIASKTGIELATVKSRIPFREYTVRELLQTIGTTLIRYVDPTWFIVRLFATLDPDKKYVIADVRFPNEVNEIEYSDGICFYILRPSGIPDPHPSENALSYAQFPCWKILVNNQSVRQFKQYFDQLLCGDFEQNMKTRRIVVSARERAINSTGQDKDVRKAVLCKSMLKPEYGLTCLYSFVSSYKAIPNSTKEWLRRQTTCKFRISFGLSTCVITPFCAETCAIFQPLFPYGSTLRTDNPYLIEDLKKLINFNIH